MRGIRIGASTSTKMALIVAARSREKPAARRREKGRAGDGVRETRLHFNVFLILGRAPEARPCIRQDSARICIYART